MVDWKNAFKATACVGLLLLGPTATPVHCAAVDSIELSGFHDVIKHWNDKYGRDRQDKTFAPQNFIAIADNILNFQLADGGWPKSFNPILDVDSAELRALLGRSLDESTLDNRCTYPHIDYLAKAHVASGERRFKAAAQRGLDYILNQQRSSGGFRGSDVDAITYNDDVMIGVMRLLREIDQQKPHWKWIDPARRARLSDALGRAIDVTLKCQIVVDGVKTAWCQQHSHETFKPVKARSYELPSICPVESTAIVRFLMQMDDPPAEVVDAIESAVAWIDRVKLTAIRIEDVEIDPVRFEGHTTSRDRIVVPDPTAPPIWTRYYEIETNRPFFCNRDGAKVYSLAEVHLERRTGYGWYSNAPRALLEKDYPTWQAKRGTADARLPRENLLVYRDQRGRAIAVQAPDDWSKRRQAIVDGMQLVMGRLPAAEKRCALKMRVVQQVQRPGYLEQLITYQSEPGSRVPAYLLIPDSVRENPQRKLPAVLCLHPTDNRIGHRVVIDSDAKPNRQYASELARRGYVTLAPSYPLLAGYQPDLKSLGWQSGTLKAVWDNMRGLDLLQSMPYVDALGFGCIGHSLGGHNSVYTAVFDDRIKAIVSSCGLDSYLDYYGGDAARWLPEQGWCQTRYMPRLADYRGRLEQIPFDFHEMIGALAPRHVLISAPLHDGNFQAASVDRIVKAARSVYTVLGHPDRLRVEHPDCGHDFPIEIRQKAYQLFDDVLRSH